MVALPFEVTKVGRDYGGTGPDPHMLRDWSQKKKKIHVLNMCYIKCLKCSPFFMIMNCYVVAYCSMMAAIAQGGRMMHLGRSSDPIQTVH